MLESLLRPSDHNNNDNNSSPNLSTLVNSILHPHDNTNFGVDLLSLQIQPDNHARNTFSNLSTMFQSPEFAQVLNSMSDGNFSILPGILRRQANRQSLTTEEIERRFPVATFLDVTDNAEHVFDTECAVCRNEYEPDSDVRRLPCGHIYHPECIDPWFLARNMRCPTCRHDINTLFQGVSTNENSVIESPESDDFVIGNVVNDDFVNENSMNDDFINMILTDILEVPSDTHAEQTGER